MTERERWIVYPLLFLALGAALRDKLSEHTKTKTHRVPGVDRVRRGERRAAARAAGADRRGAAEVGRCRRTWARSSSAARSVADGSSGRSIQANKFRRRTSTPATTSSAACRSRRTVAGDSRHLDRPIGCVLSSSKRPERVRKTAAPSEPPPTTKRRITSDEPPSADASRAGGGRAPPADTTPPAE